MLPTGTVTFLFTDIEGSTRLLQRLGDRYREVHADHAALVRKAIAGHGGVEVGTEGDSFFAVFTDAAEAVRAAVDIQRSLAAHSWPDGAVVRVRAGLHTGEGVVGGDDYLGLDVNRAARVAAAAHGGEILVSAATAKLAERALPDGGELRDLGLHRLKDLDDPERLFRVVAPGLPSAFPPLRTVTVAVEGLPRQLTSYIARPAELARVRELLGRSRMLTLTGPGGTGKTRLAVHVAADVIEDFPDGAWFVDLSAIRDPALVLPSIARVLGVREEASVPLSEALAAHLADRRVLLVLDNFEQVLEAGPDVAELLRAAPGTTALVTSRAALRVSGEQELPVPPLRLPDAGPVNVEELSRFESVALFVDRASSVRPDFRLTRENAAAVAAICVRLDGLPLAIELAAARVKLLSPQAILPRLERRLAFLSSGARDLPARQRTLRGAIDWSYDLLEEPERRLFERLSIFAGGASLDAVEAVCDPGALGLDALDALASLVEQSVVRRVELGDGEERFVLLETLREYGRVRLEERGEAAEIGERHAAHFASLALEAEAHLLGSEAPAWFERLERENDNLRAMLRWCLETPRIDLGLRAAAALWRFWNRGNLGEGRGWLRELLAHPDAAAGTAERATALTAAGGLAYWQGDFDEVESRYEEALAIYRALGDARGTMEALFNVSYVPARRGDNETARARLAEGARIAQQLGDRHALGRIESMTGYTWLMDGDVAAARPRFEESERIFEDLGDAFQLAVVKWQLGQVDRLEGRLEAAARRYRQAIRLYVQLKDGASITGMLEVMAALLSAKGRHERAVRLIGAATALRETIAGGSPEQWLLVGDPVADATAVLGEDAVRRSWDAGRRMTLDQAVVEALEDEGAQVSARQT